MNGRRAKQRRRLVAMADAGDPAAQTWCLAHMKLGEIRRTSRRRRAREAAQEAGR